MPDVQGIGLRICASVSPDDCFYTCWHLRTTALEESILEDNNVDDVDKDGGGEGD